MTSLLSSEIKSLNEVVDEIEKEELSLEVLESLLLSIKSAATQLGLSCGFTTQLDSTFESQTVGILNLIKAYIKLKKIEMEEE